MVKGIRFYVTMVSLGKEIADDDYSGEVDPECMHLPFVITKTIGSISSWWFSAYSIRNVLIVLTFLVISERQSAIYHERNKTGWGFLDNMLCKESNIERCSILNQLDLGDFVQIIVNSPYEYRINLDKVKQLGIFNLPSKLEI